MEEANLFCDVSNCGHIAHVFGIKGETKEKYCEGHILLLTNKKMSIYDISAYHFISSIEDLLIYEQRKCRVEHGLGNLTVLETQCDSELFEAQRLLEENEKKAIAIVVDSFQDIRLQVQHKYETSKQQFQAVRCNFEQYLISMQNELQESAQLLCGQVTNQLRFLRLAIEDCTLEIAKAIGESWTISREDVGATIAYLDKNKRTAFLERLDAEAIDELTRGRAQVSLQLNLYAQALVCDGDIGETKGASLEKQIECVKELQETFQLTTDLPDIEKALVKSTAAEYLQAGLTAKGEMDISQSRYLLQNAWNVLEKSGSTGKEITVVGLALWEVVGLYFGNYAEAESILRRCYDIEAELDPLSEDAMKVGNSIAGVFYHSGYSSRTIEVCIWVLHTFSNTNHAAEHFWTTLLYLTQSYWFQGKNTEAQTFVEEWKPKRMSGENELSEVLKMTVLAQYARRQGNDTEAEKMLINNVMVADQSFPTSMLAALNHRLLGLLYKDLKRLSDAEEHFRCAKAVYEAVCPQSVQAANALYNMGALDCDLKRFSEAEEHYRSAKALYEAVAPQSIQAAINLYSMGHLYKDLKRFSEAEEHYRMAESIYNAVSPQSVNAANNLNNMGHLYKDLKRFSEAEEHYRKAESIYSAVSPQSVHAAINLNNMGHLYKDLKRFSEAEECHMRAKAVYEAVSPQSGKAANNLYSMGILYKELKRFSEAEKYYRSAKALYEAIAPQSIDAANNYCNMGALYYDLKRFSEAEEYYNKAKAVYEAVSPLSVQAANNYFNMGILYEAMRRIEDASSAFSAAQSIYINTHYDSSAAKAEEAITRLHRKKSSWAQVFGFLKTR